jgi:hypothetical protein
VKATFAPSAARRFAIAAPIPLEPPVTSATLFANFDMDLLVFFKMIDRFADQLAASAFLPARLSSDV